MNRGATITHTGTLVVEHCCNCGTAFAMPSGLQAQRIKDHQEFYCPAGHRQYYTGPTEAQKLKKELDYSKQELEYANRRAASAEGRAKREQARANGFKGAMRKVKRRVSNGVCPCCTRTFKDLAAHMNQKHPDYASTEPAA